MASLLAPARCRPDAPSWQPGGPGRLSWRASSPTLLLPATATAQPRPSQAAAPGRPTSKHYQRAHEAPPRFLAPVCLYSFRVRCGGLKQPRHSPPRQLGEGRTGRKGTAKSEGLAARDARSRSIPALNFSSAFLSVRARGKMEKHHAKACNTYLQKLKVSKLRRDGEIQCAGSSRTRREIKH